MANSITTLINISQDDDRSITSSEQIEDGKTYLLYMVDSAGGSKRDKAVTLDALTDHMVEETDYRVKTSSSDENPDYLGGKFSGVDKTDRFGEVGFTETELSGGGNGLSATVFHLDGAVIDESSAITLTEEGSLTSTDGSTASLVIEGGTMATATTYTESYNNPNKVEIGGDTITLSGRQTNAYPTATLDPESLDFASSSKPYSASYGPDEASLSNSTSNTSTTITASSVTVNDDDSSVKTVLGTTDLTVSGQGGKSVYGLSATLTSSSETTLTSEGLTAAYTQEATDDEAYHSYEASMTYESVDIGDSTTNGKSSSSLTASELTLAGSDSTATTITKDDITITDNTGSGSANTVTLTADTIKAAYSSSGGGRATAITSNSIAMTDSNGVEVTLTDGTETCTITQETIKVASTSAYALIDPSQLLLSSSGSTKANVQNSGLFTSNYSSTKYWGFLNNNFLSLTEDSDALLTYDVVKGGMVIVSNASSTNYISISAYSDTAGTVYSHKVYVNYACIFLCIGQTTDGYPIFNKIGY